MLALEVISEGEDRGRVFRIQDIASGTIGRLAGSVPLHDSRVSRRHARLQFVEGQWRVKDLGSRHGTYLNQQSVTTPSAIGLGDEIHIGRVRLRVVLCTPLSAAGNGHTQTPATTADLAPRRLSEIQLHNQTLQPPATSPDPSNVAQPGALLTRVEVRSPQSTRSPDEAAAPRDATPPADAAAEAKVGPQPEAAPEPEGGGQAEPKARPPAYVTPRRLSDIQLHNQTLDKPPATLPRPDKAAQPRILITKVAMRTPQATASPDKASASRHAMRSADASAEADVVSESEAEAESESEGEGEGEGEDQAEPTTTHIASPQAAEPVILAEVHELDTVESTSAAEADNKSEAESDPEAAHPSNPSKVASHAVASDAADGSTAASPVPVNGSHPPTDRAEPAASESSASSEPPVTEPLHRTAQAGASETAPPGQSETDDRPRGASSVDAPSPSPPSPGEAAGQPNGANTSAVASPATTSGRGEAAVFAERSPGPSHAALAAANDPFIQNFEIIFPDKDGHSRETAVPASENSPGSPGRGRRLWQALAGLGVIAMISACLAVVWFLAL